MFWLEKIVLSPDLSRKKYNNLCRGGASGSRVLVFVISVCTLAVVLSLFLAPEHQPVV